MNAKSPNTAPRLIPWPAACKRRILAVDDDEPTRLLYRILFSRSGYEVDTAADGEEAWKALLSIPYDLLLTDHNMAWVTGLELVARVRAAGMTLPVVINSGCTDLGEASDYPRLALTAVLRKSFDFTELLGTVDGILRLPPDAGDKFLRTSHAGEESLDLHARSRSFSWSRGGEKPENSWRRVARTPSVSGVKGGNG